MFKLEVKLDGIEPELSRTILVPENIDFSQLDNILRIVFNFSHVHLSMFDVDGLYTPICDLEKTYPNIRAVDMNERPVKDYFTLFNKISWTYDLESPWAFTVKIKKTKIKNNHAFVESFTCEYNPVDNVDVFDFDEKLYCILNDIEFPVLLADFEMEKFDIDEVNQKLKKVV